MDDILAFLLTRKGGKAVLAFCWVMVFVSIVIAHSIIFGIVIALIAYVLWRLLENEAPDPDDDFL